MWTWQGCGSRVGTWKLQHPVSNHRPCGSLSLSLDSSSPLELSELVDSISPFHVDEGFGGGADAEAGVPVFVAPEADACDAGVPPVEEVAAAGWDDAGVPEALAPLVLVAAVVLVEDLDTAAPLLPALPSFSGMGGNRPYSESPPLAERPVLALPAEFPARAAVEEGAGFFGGGFLVVPWLFLL